MLGFAASAEQLELRGCQSSTPAIANFAMLGMFVWVILVSLLSFQISGREGVLP